MSHVDYRRPNPRTDWDNPANRQVDVCGLEAEAIPYEVRSFLGRYGAIPFLALKYPYYVQNSRTTGSVVGSGRRLGQNLGVHPDVWANRRSDLTEATRILGETLGRICGQRERLDDIWTQSTILPCIGQAGRWDSLASAYFFAFFTCQAQQFMIAYYCGLSGAGSARSRLLGLRGFCVQRFAVCGLTAEGLFNVKSRRVAVTATLRYQPELANLAPHDVRRSCARLCHAAGGETEQIQFLLGHVSVQTTETYLGCKQRLRGAVNDRIGIEP